MNNKNEHPLVLVFYLDRDLMQNPEIIKAFSEAINRLINVKQLNALALFMPTDGEERVECINPVIATDEQISHISKLIEDIKKQFSVGVDDLSNPDSNSKRWVLLNHQSVEPWQQHLGKNQILYRVALP